MAAEIPVVILGAMRHAADYAPLLAAHPSLHVVAVADDLDAGGRQREMAAELARGIGVPLEPTDAALDTVSGHGLVMVASEPTRHAALASRAIGAGCHVLVDKPVATASSDARRLGDIAREHRGQAAGYVHRLFHPSIERARALVDSGHLGVPREIQATWISANDITEEGGDIVVDPALSGGGELRNFLGYPLDTVLWVTGLEPARLHTQAITGPSALHRAHGAESLATVVVEFAHGVTAAICVGRGPAGGRGVFTLDVVGSHGAYRCDEARPAVDLVSARETAVLAGDGSFESLFTAVLDDMVAAIRDRRPLRRDLGHGCRLAEFIDLAVESSCSGQPVNAGAG